MGDPAGNARSDQGIDGLKFSKGIGVYRIAICADPIYGDRIVSGGVGCRGARSARSQTVADYPFGALGRPRYHNATANE